MRRDWKQRLRIKGKKAWLFVHKVFGGAQQRAFAGLHLEVLKQSRAVFALLLTPCNESKTQYRRVGLALISEHEKLRESDATRQTIEIV